MIEHLSRMMPIDNNNKMTNMYKNNLTYLCRKIIPTVRLWIFLEQGKNAEKMMIKRLLPLGSFARPIVVFWSKGLLKKEKLEMIQHPQTWKVYWEK